LLVICSVRDISDQKAAHDELVAVNRKLNDGLGDLEESSEELRKLTELGELLQGCVNEDEACSIIARVMARLVPGTSGGLYLIRASRNALQLASFWGQSSEDVVQVMVPEDCWALRRGRMHTAANKESTVQCRHINPQHNGYICIPMMAQGETLGILHVFLPHEYSQDCDDNDESILDAKRMLLFASSEQIGAALASLRLRDELKQQSIRDSLTGLFNRRFMEETLEREMLRASQRDTDVSVVAVDLDHFKRFNDAFGHEGGDLVLRELGVLLRKQCSASEIACRLGGEEFLLILPECSVEQAVGKAEAIRQEIEALVLTLAGQALGKITASFGIASYPLHGVRYSAVCKAADAALYHAKDKGRNRVEVARSPETSGAVEGFIRNMGRSANDVG
jgi:diguanylate cyclase (GGDEF)-like protein